MIAYHLHSSAQTEQCPQHQYHSRSQQSLTIVTQPPRYHQAYPAAMPSLSHLALTMWFLVFACAASWSIRSVVVVPSSYLLAPSMSLVAVVVLLVCFWKQIKMTSLAPAVHTHQTVALDSGRPWHEYRHSVARVC